MSLSVDCLAHVLGFLDRRSLARAGAVCRLWADAAEVVWHALCQRLFPPHTLMVSAATYATFARMGKDLNRRNGCVPTVQVDCPCPWNWNTPEIFYKNIVHRLTLAPRDRLAPHTDSNVVLRVHVDARGMHDLRSPKNSTLWNSEGSEMLREETCFSLPRSVPFSNERFPRYQWPAVLTFAPPDEMPRPDYTSFDWVYSASFTNPEYHDYRAVPGLLTIPAQHTLCSLFDPESPARISLHQTGGVSFVDDASLWCVEALCVPHARFDFPHCREDMFFRDPPFTAGDFMLI
eukprot:gnl/Spiro4/10898_TR5804_c0_g1_i1.p1 gnl/Spiro4/10898_TR5804_c0_g1~~gnl/Spiro4/10898_TR5804_c0_g1_i1.p1  ORF type:complete len:306 (-),score=74.93 gnl/Spiro4/10898_TR5804_c0_g1_i1:16-885(-)